MTAVIAAVCCGECTRCDRIARPHKASTSTTWAMSAKRPVSTKVLPQNIVIQWELDSGEPRGSFDYNAEIIAQSGSLRPVANPGMDGRVGHRLSLPLARHTTHGLRADVTGGDGNRRDDVLATFNPLFPKGACFGLIAPTGPLNHSDLHPSMKFWLKNGWSIQTSWLFFWRTKADDGVYAVPGTLLRSGAGTRLAMSGNRLALKSAGKQTPTCQFTIDLSLFSAASLPGRGAAITHDYLHCGMDNLQILNRPVKIVIEHPGSPGRGGRAPFMGRTVRRRGEWITPVMKAAPCSLPRRWPNPSHPSALFLGRRSRRLAGFGNI